MPKLTVDGIEVEVEEGQRFFRHVKKLALKSRVSFIMSVCPLRVIAEWAWLI